MDLIQWISILALSALLKLPCVSHLVDLIQWITILALSILLTCIVFMLVHGTFANLNCGVLESGSSLPYSLLL